MTETLSADLAKALASAKPAPKPAEKPIPKPPEAKPADAPPGAIPVPGAKTFLGWVASSLSRKHLTIAAAALCSLAAGIVAVRLILPQDDFKPDTATTQAVAPEAAWPEHKTIVPPGAPTLTVEPSKPTEFLPPTNLTLPPSLPSSTKSGDVPPLPEGVLIPPPPAMGDRTGTGGTSVAGLGGPVAPTKPGAERPTIPDPDSLTGPIALAGGTPPASGSSGVTLPEIPPASGLPPTLPMVPDPAALKPVPMSTEVIGPTIPDPTDPTTSNPPAPIVGRPPSSPTVPPAPDPLVPSVGSALTLPPLPGDLKPTPPPTTSGATINLIKPAESGTVTPAGGMARPPATSYDVDIYHPKANDSWEAISREYYNDTKFATALKAYNRNKPLAGTVDVPPINIVKRYAPQPIAATPTGGDPWNAAGAASAGSNVTKVYRVPAGNGMSLPAVAKLVLGTEQRWQEIFDLNPTVTNATNVPAGTELRLPADARVQ